MRARDLLDDAGCSLCAALAREVEALSEGRLRVRSLREPEVQALLDRVRPGWRWEPMLLEEEGERVRVYTGLAMRARLIQVLGPVRAWRVAQVVARFGGPVLGVDWERRTFLRRAIGALAGWIALRGLGQSLPAAAAPPTPQGPSSRLVRADEPLYQVLRAYASAHFSPERWTATPEWNQVLLWSSEKGRAIVVPLRPAFRGNRYLAAPLKGEDILALYVVEVELQAGPSLSGHIRLYHPDGQLLLHTHLENGTVRSEPTTSSFKAPGHARSAPRPKEAICCRPEFYLCLADATSACAYVCAVFGPAACAACLAGLYAACAAAFCYIC